MLSQTDEVYKTIKALLDRGASLKMIETGLKQTMTVNKTKKFMKMAEDYANMRRYETRNNSYGT